MYPFFKNQLFRLEPEAAHHLTLNLIGLAGKIAPIRWLLEVMYGAPEDPIELFGLRFKNRVGLAAGYDKDAQALRGLGALGFGHIEVGTITPQPQPGNAKPRVFRLLEDEGVINRMGFPSRGSEYTQSKLSVGAKMSIANALGLTASDHKNARLQLPFILSVNIGKNKATPNTEAAFDYLALLQNFAPLADMITVNISSPNTVGLRDLQAKEELSKLLSELHAQRLFTQKEIQRKLPIVVKIAPDLDERGLEEAVETIIEQRMDGIIATNTTLRRDGLRSPCAGEAGGCSGAPLRGLSEKVLERTISLANGRVPIISAGGIMSPADAARRIEMGASLVQLYTGLIYAGPGLVKGCVKATRRE